MLGTYISLALVMGGTAFAATTYSVYNVPDMFLYAGINTTATTNIRVTGPIRNRVVVTYPALGGGVLEVREGSKVEHIYYSVATVDATTKVITLTGSVIRDLCWNTANTYVGCGDGQSFSRGAQVRLVDDARLFNLSFHKDVSNTCTASGCIQFTGSGSLGVPVFATTADRDQQLGATPADNKGFACVTATGACYYAAGASWNQIGNTGVVNASDTVAGKCQIVTLAALNSLTETGSTGAINCISPRTVIKNGSGSTSAGRLPLTNSRGVISVTLGGTGTGSSAGIASGALLMGQGKNGMKAIYPSNGNILIGQGNGWGSATLTGSSVPVVVMRKFPNYTRQLGASETFSLSGSYTIPAGTTTVGQSYEIIERLTLNNNDTLGVLKLNVGSNSVTILTGQNSVQDNLVFIKCSIVFKAIGGSGSYGYDCEARYNGVTTRTTSTTATSLDTTANQLIKFTFVGGGGGANPHITELESIYSRY